MELEDMNIDHLLPDELQIEYLVRNIEGTDDEKRAQLTDQLKDEVEDTPGPNRPHKNAYRGPRREIVIISKKVKEIYDSVKRLSLEPTLQEEGLKQLYSRSLHILFRLERMTYSKAVINEVDKQKESIQKIGECITKILAKDANVSAEGGELDDVEVTMLDDDYCKDEKEVQPTLQGQDVHAPLGTSSPLRVSEVGHSANSPNPATSTLQPHIPQNPISQPPIPQNLQLQPPINQTPFSQPMQQTMTHQHQSGEVMQRPPNYQISAGSVTHQQTITQYPLAHQPPISNTPSSVPVLSSQNQHGDNKIYEPIFSRRNISFNISFDGSRGGLPIERFIFRFESMASSFRVPPAQKVNEIVFLLKGTAAEYYWSILEMQRGSIEWDVLKTKLLERFGDPRQDVDILRAMNNRVQKKGETFTQFLSEIQTMAVPLKDQMKEEALIALLTRNMSMELQLKTAGEPFSTMRQLHNRCASIEESWFHIKQYASITKNRVDEIEGALATNVDEIKESVEALRFSANKPRQFNNPRPSDVCWNCKLNGHRFMDCPNPITSTFCFGCGKPNTVKPNCSVCHPKSENSMRERETAGSSHSLQQQTALSQKLDNQTDAAANTDPELLRLQRSQRF